MAKVTRSTLVLPVRAGARSVQKVTPVPVVERPMPPRRTRTAPRGRVLGLADAERATYATVGKQHGLHEIPFDFQPADPVWIYRGNLAVDRFETPVKPKSGKLPLIIVEGNLWVSRSFELVAHEDDDDYFLLRVTGNLSARTLFVAGDPLVEIGGSVELEAVGALGEGNTLFEVGETLSAQVLVRTANATIKAQKLDAMLISDTKVAKKRPDYTSDQASAVLDARFLDGDNVDMQALRGALRKGIEVLRPTLREPHD